MHCVVNKDGIVVALFLTDDDAQDFIDHCGPLYSWKEYTLKYLEKFQPVAIEAMGDAACAIGW